MFDRESMDFQADRATLLEVPLSGVSARMEDVATGKLEVDGRAQGDVAQMLKFVNISPLVNTIGAVTRPMVAKGPASLELKLALPLKDLQATTRDGSTWPARPSSSRPRR